MKNSEYRIDINKWYYGICSIFFIILLFPQVRLFFNDAGIRWVYILIFSGVLSYILVPFAESISFRKDFIDIPNEFRKIHSRATPLLGGFAVYIAFLASLGLNNIFSPQVLAIIMSVTLIMVSGIIDIKFKLKAVYRLIVQIIAVSIVVSSGIVLTIFPQNTLLWYLNIPFTFLWIIGLTNAMNFFDGMDGLAAGLSIIISFFLCILAYQNSQPFLGWIAIAIIGACLGFLPYNLKESGSASIFLGDSGSNFLGFTLACMAIQVDWSEKNTMVSVIAPILIFSILIYDMAYITVERFVSGKVSNFREWVEYVGKDHLHHRMDALFKGKRKTVFFIFLLNIALGCSALVMRNADNFDLFILIFQGAVFLVVITVLERLGNKVRQNPESLNTENEKK